MNKRNMGKTQITFFSKRNADIDVKRKGYFMKSLARIQAQIQAN